MGKKRKFNRFIRWIKSDLPEDNKSVLLLGVTKIPSPTLTPRGRPHTLHLDHHLVAKSQTLDSYPRLKPRLFRSRSKDSLNELLTRRSDVNFKPETNPTFIIANKIPENLNGKSKFNSLGTTHKPETLNEIPKSELNGDLRKEIVKTNDQFPKREYLNGKAHDFQKEIVKTTDVKLSKRVSFDVNNLNQGKSDCKSELSGSNDSSDRITSGCLNCNQTKSGCNGDSKLGFCTELPYGFYHPKSDFFESKTDDVNRSDLVMDKSVDSIGSCSLDVDASSTDFSDSSVGSSDCTLRSLGIPTPVKTPNLVPTFQIEPTVTITDVSEPKKPSYLNLACTVNGYSNITNYDSKLRENFRISKSREVSPIRPQDYHANITTNQNGEHPKFLTPNYTKSLLSSPSKMTESKSHTILQSSQTGYSYSSSTKRTMTYMSKESRNFATSMLYSAGVESDTVDNVNFSQKTNGIQTKYSSFESSKISQNGQNTFVNGNGSSYSETSVQENYTNGQTKTKSFIQQRVERLYGPGALAQGFFISKRTKNRSSESENQENGTNYSANNSINTSSDSYQSSGKIDSENDSNLKQSTSSPSLPVLRHLRPEFRAQLPILSPKRIFNENMMQKSTTVPSLTIAPEANGFAETLITNGTKPVKTGTNISINGTKPLETSVENKENLERSIDMLKTPVMLEKLSLNTSEIITEEIPAAPQVILPIPTPEVIVNAVNASELNGCANTEVKDGHYFLKILKNETDRLIILAEKVEAELEKNKNLSDDVLGYLRSASGKARLLVTQKMQQFEGLCHKNINQIDGEPFPTTAEDLQGFWDMVMLQVTQVDKLFAELDTLKANNWVIQEKPKPDSVDSAKPKKILVKKIVSAEAEAQRKQREAARKKMIEERRKAMRNKQSQSEQAIEIFVPESS